MKQILIFIALMCTLTVNAQSKLEKEQKAVKENGFKYLRAYNLDFSQKTTYSTSYVFTSQSTYLIKVDNCDVMIEVYDSEKRLITSNYVSQEKRCLNAISIKCYKSGVYQIKYSLRKSSAEKDFISVIGFKTSASTQNFNIAALSKM